MRKLHLQYHGFTLIELSLLLVIIGLIVGGILTGRALIDAAQTRNQIKQMEDLQIQMNTFLGKYGCMPGDCINATTFLGTTGTNGYTIGNGDGDGIVHATWGANTAYGANNCFGAAPSGEVSQLFLHLSSAGMGAYNINGNLSHLLTANAGAEYPFVALGNGTGMIVTCMYDVSYPGLMSTFMLNRNNVILIGIGATNEFRIGYAVGTYGIGAFGTYGNDGSGHVLSMGIPAETASSIDTKIDDGLPNKGAFGIVTGSTGCAGNVTAYPASSTACRVTAGRIIN